MTSAEAIAAAEEVLQERVDSAGANDRRWKAIAAIANFVETEPEDVWAFVARWGSTADEDLQQAIGTCLLEHLLQYWFDRFFSRVEVAARNDPQFARTFLVCWQFGQSKVGENAGRFQRLRKELGRL
jgi:hypothetical protein